ncbi:hypothetical protein ACFXTI_029272 [Malus domestica]
MAYVISAMFSARPDQPATMEGDYMTTEPMMAHVSVESPKHFACQSPETHIRYSPFGRSVFQKNFIDGGAAVNVLPAKQMKKLGKGIDDLIPTDLTVSSFSGAITKTHGILPLEVDLGSKQIMLAFFVVDCTSTYGALLGRDWIHQSLAIPSTLHQQMVEAESRSFLPTANVAKASFYNPNVGILKCSEADENGRPTKVTAQKLLEQGMFLTREGLLVYGKGRRQENELLDR